MDNICNHMAFRLCVFVNAASNGIVGGNVCHTLGMDMAATQYGCSRVEAVYFFA